MQRSIAMTQIDLLRHGKVDGPAALYGRTDINISKQGLQQMQQQVENLAQPDLVVTSPLRRCKIFAEHTAARNDVPLHIEDSFSECDFGEWDGIQFDDQSQQWPLMTTFWQDPLHNSPPQGESLEHFHTRVVKAWQNLLTEHPGKYTLMVCHGGVIRQILAHILPADWRDGAWYSQLQIGHASLTRITMPTCENAKPIANFIGLPVNFRQPDAD